MADLLIREVELPSGRRADLGISGSHLVEPDALTNPQVIDAAGLIALPGLVDLHTHLRQPSPQPAETIASGTAAAARGGYTAVFAMANTDPVTDTPQRVQHLLELAEGSSAEVIPVGAITKDLAGLELSDLAGMHQAGVNLFSDDGQCLMDAHLMRQALQQAASFDGVIAQHSQDRCLARPTAWLPDSLSLASLPPDQPTNHRLDSDNRPGHSDNRPGSPVRVDDSSMVWPAVAEAAIVARDIQLARDTGARLHICHVSTAETVEVLRWAKQRRILVTAEVTGHHLLLGSDCLAGLDTTFKVNPPLRDDEDRLALRQALADGTIDIVATDHAPHHQSDKDKPLTEAKPGMIGLEYALAVVIETMVLPGLLDWSAVADRMSQAPARLGRVSTRQGRALVLGEPATLTLIDPTRRAVIDRGKSLSQGRNNPYHGLNLPDPVLATFWAGRATYIGSPLSPR